MSIYLKRNGEAGKWHSFVESYTKKGYIYKLIELQRYSNIPSSVRIRTKHKYSGDNFDLWCDLNCFDYAKSLK